ncbi:Aldose 1-epimerase [Candidatus Sulfopaludibacter sp. SbA4]|nr:Aldose 1-epimerase [Candidatus Sulfopaludibacter sp. SbA4]
MNRFLRCAALLPIGCAANPPATVHWGDAPGGDPIYLYTLANAKGMEARVTNFGAILVSLKTPDRRGALADIVLGFDTFDGYLNTKRYFGATVGRYANRIAHGAFTLDGHAYTLARNNGENSLHGGVRGFHKAIWKGRAIAGPPPAVEFTYLSRDGEEGYPGNLSVTVRYTLTDANELRIEYTAATDKPTVVNLTNHSFFNLAGEGAGDVLRHVVTIDADRFTPVDAGQIPTGELQSVGGTPFDFRKPTAIGARIDAQGYDHNYVLNHAPGKLGFAARVTEPGSGRIMEVLTSEPGVQFYTANTLDGSDRGKGGHVYGPRSAFCMETQHFPDSPNRPDFPTTVLRPGASFRSTTVYRFRAR